MTSPPPWEVADVIRMAESKFRESVTGAYLKVLNAITRCRTAALGGHRDRCVHCGYQTISFNSCRNRQCPKCQVNARERWLRGREQELLSVRYFHVVFSVPHRLIPLELPDLDAVELERVLKRDPCRFCGFDWVCPEMEREAEGE